MDTPTDAEAARAERNSWIKDYEREISGLLKLVHSLEENLVAAHAAGRREGLEEAAKIAEAWGLAEATDEYDDWTHGMKYVAREAAAAIRART